MSCLLLYFWLPFENNDIFFFLLLLFVFFCLLLSFLTSDNLESFYSSPAPPWLQLIWYALCINLMTAAAAAAPQPAIWRVLVWTGAEVWAGWEGLVFLQTVLPVISPHFAMLCFVGE